MGFPPSSPAGVLHSTAMEQIVSLSSDASRAGRHSFSDRWSRVPKTSAAHLAFVPTPSSAGLSTPTDVASIAGISTPSDFSGDAGLPSGNDDLLEQPLAIFENSDEELPMSPSKSARRRQRRRR